MRAMFQPLRSWLISGAPSGQKKAVQELFRAGQKLTPGIGFQREPKRYSRGQLDVSFLHRSDRVAQSYCFYFRFGHRSLGISPKPQARLSRRCILFALSVFSLLAMPSINRAIHANRPPDISTQTQQKIDAAVKEAVDQVLMQEGHPVVAAKQTIRFPFGPMVLVFGLWLVSRREPHQPNN